MALPPSRSAGKHRTLSGSPRPATAATSGSLSSRFSSMAAERISSSHSPAHQMRSRSGVQKSTGNRRNRSGRAERGMEIDSVESASNFLKSRGDGKPRRPASHPQRQDRSRNGGRRQGGDSKDSKKSGASNSKKPVSQTDLDRELDAYMMKNDSTAKTSLDMDLDAYMAAAPSKKD